MDYRRNRVKLEMAALGIIAFIAAAAALMPAFNPARLSVNISKNASLFTCAVSYDTIGENFVRALTRGWITQPALSMAYAGALIVMLGVAGLVGVACVSLGNYKMKHLSAKMYAASSLVGLIGSVILRVGYGYFVNAPDPGRVEPMLPAGSLFYFVLFGLVLIVSVFTWVTLPKPQTEERYEMDAKFRLFLMILPFIVLVAIFSYLPLWGWRIAFYDYRAGFDLTAENFVGLKWLDYLFSNAATRADILRVLGNTFAMSGIGIATSWVPMAFAIFLSEMGSNKTRRLVQTFTTIPNFISWVLVYSVAFALLSTEGFLNWALTNLGIIEEGSNYLMDNGNMWLKMWAWGTWKGLGWSAIIYIAGISGIDQQLYEAATVDGAGRFKKMWYITVPGLMSTFFVLLLLSIANVLSNGMDQYLVFYNSANRSTIQVLDLYVYQIGLASNTSNAIPLATLIGIFKSVISVTLLFSANKVSAMLRGESII